ncbi:MAG: hypothetical protein DRP18_05595 [Candidatus Aenigmatarchaeota archaeon]|nr:MAG: hypothetical protein DRP18_05595 [Candidatus Aenigmarchaeota archaeon]
MNFLKKAQVAFEYLMIFGIVLGFAIPVWIYVSNLQAQTGTDMCLSYAKNTANQIADTADLVYSQGAPAKVRIKVYIPKHVVSANITGREINFNMSYMDGYTDVFATSMASLNGSLPNLEGVYWIEIEATDSGVDITPV